MIEHKIDPDKCKHQKTEVVVVDPIGGSVYLCLECGEYIDPDLQGAPTEDDLMDWDDIEPIEF